MTARCWIAGVLLLGLAGVPLLAAEVTEEVTVVRTADDESGASRPGLRIVDTVLAHAPLLVRPGAELYCLRLEMTRLFYTADKRDKAMDDLIAKATTNVGKFGEAALDLAIDLREQVKKLGPFQMVRRFAMKHGAGLPGGPIGPGGQDLMNRLRGAGGKRLAVAKAYARRVILAVRLTEEQRNQLKLDALSMVPDVVRPGTEILAAGMNLARALMAPTIDRKVCMEHIGKITTELGTVLSKGADLAFQMKARLDEAQRQRLLANIPLRFLLFR